MRFFINNLKKASLCIFGVALTWVLFFKLNTFVFSYFEQSQFVNWIFMPAGIRLLAVLLFDEYAAIGLFIGALITSPELSTNITESLVISLISALNPYIAIHITKRLLKVDNPLARLHAKELLLIAVFSAAFNCLSHHLYFYLVALKASWPNCLTMFIGDLLGITITFMFFNMVLKFIRKSTLATAQEEPNNYEDISRY